jgi:hypothetical protein
MLPFLNPRTPAGAAPENLRASGRLTLDQFTLAPLVVRHLQGDLKIDGRHIALANTTGQFYGGQVAGSLDADLGSPPAYRADLNFSRIDGAALAAATPALSGVTAKSVAGHISIATAGGSRADLSASLTCQGSATALLPKLLNVDVWQVRGPESPIVKSTEFDSADSSFSCAQRKIEFQSLSLGIGFEKSEVGTGTIGFNRDLDLHFQAHSSLVGNQIAPPPSFNLSGSLAEPNVVPAQPPLRRSR